MAQHTPGTWKVLKGAAEGDDMRCTVIVEQGKSQYLIATIENGAPGDFCETGEANARLTAAGPDMLAALEDIIQRNEIQHWFNLDKARAAVAKAKG